MHFKLDIIMIARIHQRIFGAWDNRLIERLVRTINYSTWIKIILLCINKSNPENSKFSVDHFSKEIMYHAITIVLFFDIVNDLQK